MLDQHDRCHHMATVVCELGCSRAKVRGLYILMIFFCYPNVNTHRDQLGRILIYSLGKKTSLIYLHTFKTKAIKIAF